jgi:tetratricopeptide (TPR) repeat protein
MTAGAEDSLSDLLAEGERSALRGTPSDALPPLRAALAMATQAGKLPEGLAAGWLLGVALGAAGRYGEAMDVLEPLTSALSGAAGSDASTALFGALAAATSASIHRQLGRHLAARDLDDEGWAAADPLGTVADEARLDCAIGLAADAVGLSDAATATSWAERAAELLEARSDPGWRLQVRLDWVRSEIALLGGDAQEAVAAAGRALRIAERARAPRHVAKSLLFQGVAQATASADTAVGTLRRAAALAEGLGTLPLVWPARAVLGALLGDAGREDLATAGRAVQEIADGLPESLRADWLSRDDISALLAAAD